jgi:hypothetical protein
VTNDAILAMLRVPEGILTQRFYTLLGGRERGSTGAGSNPGSGGSSSRRGSSDGGGGGGGSGSGAHGENHNRRAPARRVTLEELLGALANLKARIPVRTRAAAVSRARTLSEQEARLEFAFALYDLDGNGGGELTTHNRPLITFLVL